MPQQPIPDNRVLREPKIFGLLIENQRTLFLSVQFSYSLEEAFLMAKQEFIIQNPKSEEKLLGAKISLFTIKNLNEMFFDSTNQPAIIKVEPDPVTHIPVLRKIQESPIAIVATKNDLMIKIIKNKDLGMLKKNKEQFSSQELKYIREHIKLNVQTKTLDK